MEAIVLCNTVLEQLGSHSTMECFDTAFFFVPPHSNKEVTARMRIFVVTLSGRTLMHEVECSDTVNMLKTRIMEVDGIPANHQRLVFSGK